MMKTHRTTYTLVVLFFASLLALWGLEYYGVRTAKENLVRESLILPELLETPAAGIRKVSIERGKERLVFERRNSGVSRWQMVEPLNVAAEPARLETLVRNLKELRRSLDAGSLTGPPASFGLDDPEAVVRLWGGQNSDGTKDNEPLSTIEIGKTVKRLRYLRTGEGGTIEVADAKLLNAVDQPISEWRERALVPLATFQIEAVSIKRGGKTIRVTRRHNGRFRLLEPNIAPAEGPKVESLLAALVSLRVADAEKGFVANDVRDLGPYGLSPPAAVVELTTSQEKDKPLVLEIGKRVPDHPDRVYVRQGDQNDVVMVSEKPLEEIPRTAVSLRSQKVCDFEPIAVSEIRINSPKLSFLLKKEANGWVQKEPTAEKADGFAVVSLLKQLDALQTSEFLEAERVRDPKLNPPQATIQIRETRVGRTAATSAEGELVVDLHLGRLDAARKILYAQLDRDEVILTIPDTLIQALPKNAMAFRDRSVGTPGAAAVRKLTVTRAGRVDELVPVENGAPNRWRMRKPIDAPADTRSVTQIVAVLANLRAEGFVSDNQEDPAKFGLDHPLIEVEWETDKPHRLKVGGQVPRESAYYAATDDQPSVFTLSAETLKPFEAEFRDHLVMTFPLAKAERVVLTWSRPDRTAAFRHREPTTKGGVEWVGVPGSDSGGIDLASVTALAKALSHLETVQYWQYDGEIQAYTGLVHPRLTVTVKFGANEADRVIRIGYGAGPGLLYAAEGTSLTGPVFELPAVSWDMLIQLGQRLAPLPADLFSHASSGQPR